MLDKLKTKLELNNPALFREQSYLNGKWMSAENGETFAVTNPADGSLLAEVSEQDLAAASDRIPLAGEGLRAATDTLRLSEARFQAGTAIALEVLDAQDLLAQARFNLARAIVEFNTAQARLLAASGTIDRASFLPGSSP